MARDYKHPTARCASPLKPLPVALLSSAFTASHGGSESQSPNSVFAKNLVKALDRHLVSLTRVRGAWSPTRSYPIARANLRHAIPHMLPGGFCHCRQSFDLRPRKL